MKRSPMTKLAAAARAILNADDFARECEGIVESYRREHEFDVRRPSVRDTRQALKQFSRYVDALVTWCGRAGVVEVNPSRAEQMALMRIRTLLSEQNRRADLDAALAELVTMTTVVPQAIRGISRHHKTAQMIAADWLRETFKRRRLKLPTSILAAKLLVEIAQAAGDGSMTEAAAKRALIQAGNRAKKKTAD
jgi:hypothetical protein